MSNNQPIDSKEGGTPDSLNFEGYDPIGCDHTFPSGFSSWMFLSGEQGAGPDMDIDVHLCCCSKCGEVKIGGRRLGKGVLNHFHEEFGLHYPDAVSAIIKCCNWFCRDNEGYDPFVRLSQARVCHKAEGESAAEAAKEETIPDEEYFARIKWRLGQIFSSKITMSADGRAIEGNPAVHAMAEWVLEHVKHRLGSLPSTKAEDSFDQWLIRNTTGQLYYGPIKKTVSELRDIFLQQSQNKK